MDSNPHEKEWIQSSIIPQNMMLENSTQNQDFGELHKISQNVHFVRERDPQDKIHDLMNRGLDSNISRS